jgi:hypothetical protein
VRIDLFAKEDEDSSSSEADFSAYTNPNGYYEIDHVPYGTYAKVMFSLNGYDIKLVSYIAVNSGEKLMSATLKGETESSTFSGEVRDTYGNPVRFARVDLYDENGESVFSGYSDETADTGLPVSPTAHMQRSWQPKPDMSPTHMTTFSFRSVLRTATFP